MENKINKPNYQFYDEVKQILAQARHTTYAAINATMVQAYWHIGKRIVEEEQQGEKKAQYGKHLVKELSKQLTAEFGKGFGQRNINYFRKFYLAFPDYEMVHTLYAQLSWSHYKHLLRVQDEGARVYYLTEAAQNHWSTRMLDRNISTQYYQRLIQSNNKENVVSEMLKKTESLQASPQQFIKNPSVLEFLNLPNNFDYTEQQLEKALIDDIQSFLLELGKGFAFVGRQQLVRTESSDFYIDLVFYNYLLKCFVLIEIKTEKMTHQDIGQLDMYVRMYDDLKRNEGDNPTIGILLCADTDKTIAKYSVLKDNQQLFASKYLSYLPSEAELKAEIERQR
ncbi:MAG: PDDEXK nuclease domain-containing protein, partial [Bacteroidales bacterium]|nr:PDDEXK nuclease domain-containing protein [Bacteroidales bacterium]